MFGKSSNSNCISIQALKRLWGAGLWGEGSLFHQQQVITVMHNSFIHNSIHEITIVSCCCRLKWDWACSKEHDWQHDIHTFKNLNVFPCWRNMYLRLHMIHTAEEMCICDSHSNVFTILTSDKSLSLSSDDKSPPRHHAAWISRAGGGSLRWGDSDKCRQNSKRKEASDCDDSLQGGDRLQDDLWRQPGL